MITDKTEYAIISFAASLFTALLTTFLNNWYATRRERRRGAGEAAERLRAAARRRGVLPGDDLDLIHRSTSRWRRKGLNRAIEAYKKSTGPENRERDGMGGFFWKDETLITHAISDLLRYLRLK